ncbi:MAG: OmpA family protein [Flavobacteriales bacterium]|nr:OmpA family protein [Flavobacteriales bacterium]
MVSFKVEIQVIDDSTSTKVPDLALLLADEDGSGMIASPAQVRTSEAGRIRVQLTDTVKKKWLVKRDPRLSIGLDKARFPDGRVVMLDSPDEALVTFERAGQQPARIKIASVGTRIITLTVRVTGVPLPCEWVLSDQETAGPCVNDVRRFTREFVPAVAGCQPTGRPAAQTREAPCCLWVPGQPAFSACVEGSRTRTTPYVSSVSGCVPAENKPVDEVAPAPCSCEWVPGPPEVGRCVNGSRTVTAQFVAAWPECDPPGPRPAAVTRRERCGCQWVIGPEKRGECIDGTRTIASMFVSDAADCTPDAPRPEPVKRTEVCGPCRWMLGTEDAGECVNGMWTFRTPYVRTPAGCSTKADRPADRIRREVRPCQGSDTLSGLDTSSASNRLKERMEFRFTAGSADPGAATQADLRRALEALNADQWLLITGHADEQGSHADNYQLALARANAIARMCYMLGIAPDRVQVLVFGGYPISGLAESGQLNRMVTVMIMPGEP